MTRNDSCQKLHGFLCAPLGAPFRMAWALLRLDCGFGANLCHLQKRVTLLLRARVSCPMKALIQKPTILLGCTHDISTSQCFAPADRVMITALSSHPEQPLSRNLEVLLCYALSVIGS